MLTLLIDAHYLAWRAYYTTGKLTYEGEPTGVIFGFMRDIMVLRDRFNTHQLVFCFDGPGNLSLRKKTYPMYKFNRSNIHFSPEEQRNINNMRLQIKLLHDDVLPGMGFKNIFKEDGYEGDDLIARAAIDMPSKEIIIVSGDEDLLQLITKRVSCYNPRDASLINLRLFKKKYGITPDQWSTVKAMCGCKSDNISGIKGIGQKTALKFLQGKIPLQLVAYKRIYSGKDTIERNLPLVHLPFEGCPAMSIEVQEEVEYCQWKQVMDRFGIRALKGD